MLALGRMREFRSSMSASHPQNLRHNPAKMLLLAENHRKLVWKWSIDDMEIDGDILVPMRCVQGWQAVVNLVDKARSNGGI